jgi:L-asparaginase / beta-aspartyl-peptidase
MKPVIAIHGGAGVILEEKLTPELIETYHHGLEFALDEGYKLLLQGAPALEATQAAVIALEDNPLFNAGRGAVLTYEGKCELDASLMDGATRNAGAITGVLGVRNPILLARLVMERSGHVMLCGHGAEEFARENGVAFEPPEYFLTEQRIHQWERVRGTSTTLLDHSDKYDIPPTELSEAERKSGTVGAVALDVNGNLAAATSTGGMTNKRWGRIGDSPIIGAGTWADQVVAVSCTGHGEYFMRYVAAYEVSALMRYRGLDLDNACRELIFNQLLPDGGEGGLIAVDRNGNISLPFNTPGMYRGYIDRDGKRGTAIFKQS